jgi:hypothetical protein
MIFNIPYQINLLSEIIETKENFLNSLKDEMTFKRLDD